MKKILIFLLLFSTFAFSWFEEIHEALVEWPIQFIADLLKANDGLIVGDTTNFGGFYCFPPRSKFLGDTLWWDGWLDGGVALLHPDAAYITTRGSDYEFLFTSWFTGGGKFTFRSDECKVDTNEIVFFHATIEPGLDTADWLGAGPTFSYNRVGSPNKRFGEAWFKHYCANDASGADTADNYMGPDSFHVTSENPYAFEPQIRFYDGVFVEESLVIANGAAVVGGSYTVIDTITYESSSFDIVTLTDYDIVTDVFLRVYTVWDADPTIDIGDGGDNDGYLPDASITWTGVTGNYGEEHDTRGDLLYDGTNNHNISKMYWGSLNKNLRVTVTTQNSATQGGAVVIFFVKRIQH